MPVIIIVVIIIVVLLRGATPVDESRIHPLHALLVHSLTDHHSDILGHIDSCCRPGELDAHDGSREASRKVCPLRFRPLCGLMMYDTGVGNALA
mmetsp:Transcript_11233/g.21545  ORF Transcript_11233/g.21545 Transcript_11233/m.21545 type:complete len:94 (+) Transcript_11233:256-537(+)